MNEHTRALQSKLAGTSAIISAVLPRTARARPWHVMLTSLNVSLSNYLLGDLYVTPRYGKEAGAVVDGVNAGIMTLLTSRVLPGMRVGPLGFAATAGAVGVAEWFSRVYLEDDRSPAFDDDITQSVHVGELEEIDQMALPLPTPNGDLRRRRRAVAVRRSPEV